MTTVADGPLQAGIDDIVGGIRGMMVDSKATGADTQVPQAEILARSSPKRPVRPQGVGMPLGRMRHRRVTAMLCYYQL
jgi:hypothetical protein